MLFSSSVGRNKRSTLHHLIDGLAQKPMRLRISPKRRNKAIAPYGLRRTENLNYHEAALR
jgi:hypothetical protein